MKFLDRSNWGVCWQIQKPLKAVGKIGFDLSFEAFKFYPA